jgi:hypothetical protein
MIPKRIRNKAPDLPGSVVAEVVAVVLIAATTPLWLLG